jgi:hypothetical protein
MTPRTVLPVALPASAFHDSGGLRRGPLAAAVVRRCPAGKKRPQGMKSRVDRGASCSTCFQCGEPFF